MSSNEDKLRGKSKLWLPAIVLIICFLGIIAVGLSFFRYPSRSKEVKTLKAMIPDATCFVNDNPKFMSFLLDVKGRIRKINAQGAEQDDFIPIDYCEIQNYLGEVEFRLYGDSRKKNADLLLLTEDEQRLVSETLLKLELLTGGTPNIYIYPNGIRIGFASLEKIALGIENPVREIEDTGRYEGRFGFTVHLNDDWCINIGSGSWD